MSKKELSVPIGLGLSYGLLTVYALISGSEHYVLPALLLILVVRRIKLSFADRRIFLRGFVDGALLVLSALWTQVLLMPLYLQNNPDYSNTELPFQLSESLFTLAFSPIGAVISGSICGTTVYLVVLLIKRYRPVNRRNIEQNL